MSVPIKHLNPDDGKNVKENGHQGSDEYHGDKSLDHSGPNLLNFWNSGDHIEYTKDANDSQVLNGH
jgi:hypothetical protein